MTERFRGKLLDGGRVLVEGIVGTIHHDPGPPPSWRGTFDAPAGGTLPLRRVVTLVLDDGRQGAIFINRINPAAAPEPVEFQGSGPLA
jgi:hypothetical protein